MSGLRDMAEQLARRGGHPTPYATRKPHTEKLADRWQDRPVHMPADPEPWDQFLRRIGVIGAGERDG